MFSVSCFTSCSGSPPQVQPPRGWRSSPYFRVAFLAAGRSSEFCGPALPAAPLFRRFLWSRESLSTPWPGRSSRGCGLPSDGMARALSRNQDAAEPAAAADSLRFAALAAEPPAVRRHARNMRGRAGNHPRRSPHPHRAPVPSWPAPAEISPQERPALPAQRFPANATSGPLEQHPGPGVSSSHVPSHKAALAEPAAAADSLALAAEPHDVRRFADEVEL